MISVMHTLLESMFKCVHLYAALKYGIFLKNTLELEGRNITIIFWNIITMDRNVK